MNSTTICKKNITKQKKGIFIDKGPDLPLTYNINYLVLLPVHPRNVFAYWDTEGEISDLIVRLYKKNRKIAEINANESKDYYFNKRVEPDANYQATMGYYKNGKFCLIARSNKITTPRASISKQDGNAGTWIQLLYDMRTKIFRDTSGSQSLSELVRKKRSEYFKRFLPNSNAIYYNKRRR